MPSLKTYGLFISHAWRYNEDYARLVEMLQSAPLFIWHNYSVPRHDPLIDPNTIVGKGRLLSELDDQIRPVNCVLVISGMYVAYSEWIQAEINIAQRYGKPIIGIRPWNQQNIPRAVFDAANTMVGWNTPTIISAIRGYSI